LALALGDVEIVSADSMQVYRGMDIGTAKPGAAERALVLHHLIDVVEPSEDWDVARFIAAGRRALEDISARGKRALFVGGTGLYLHALIDGFAVPGTFPQVRDQLEAQPSTDELYRRLKELDPDAAALIHPRNRRRTIRALEVTLGSGRRFSSYGPGVGVFPPTPWRLAGVWLPRRVVAARIEHRFNAMMDAGLLAEVRALASRPGGLSRTARQALGYKELLAHLEEGVPLGQAVGEAVRRTRQFSRRQRMWWRRDPRVRWFGSAEDPMQLLPALIMNFR
jgi:tRNA dimethylallyltransferase